jgi:predicted  nucleic acid-binding Zn-ribbon protein
MNQDNYVVSLLETLVQEVTKQGQKLENVEQGQAKLEQGQAKLMDKVTGLEQRQENLEQGQAKLMDKVTGLEQRQEKMTDEIADLKQEVISIKVLMENEIRPAIKRLAEGYGIVINRLDHMQPDVEETRDDVDVIKKVVTSHSMEIHSLKRAI